MARTDVVHAHLFNQRRVSAQRYHSQPGPHERSNGDFMVFDLMADIEDLVRQHLGRAFLRDSWPILQQILSAHVLQRELFLGDLLLSLNQPTETSLQCIERLSDEGLLKINGGVWGDGVATIALSDKGIVAAQALADGILQSITDTCSRAGMVTVNGPSRPRLRSSRHQAAPPVRARS